jgi:Ca2+-binding EF-hand superfamily protein
MKSLSQQLASLNNELKAEAKAKESFQAYQAEKNSKVSKEELNKLISQREQEVSHKGNKSHDQLLKKAYGI